MPRLQQARCCPRPQQGAVRASRSCGEILASFISHLPAVQRRHACDIRCRFFPPVARRQRVQLAHCLATRRRSLIGCDGSWQAAASLKLRGSHQTPDTNDHRSQPLSFSLQAASGFRLQGRSAPQRLVASCFALPHADRLSPPLACCSFHLQLH